MGGGAAIGEILLKTRIEGFAPPFTSILGVGLVERGATGPTDGGHDSSSPGRCDKDQI